MRNRMFVGVAILIVALWTAAGAMAQTPTTTTGTAQELGPFTYYNFFSSDGTTVTGTAQTLGPFTYYNLHISDGTSTSGSSQELGPFTHYNFNSSGADAGRFKRSTTTGTSQQLGPFTHYNFSTTGTDRGRFETKTTTGTSQQLGPFTHFNLQGSDGSSTSGSILELGGTGLWDLTKTEPAEADSDPFGSLWEED